MPKVGYVSNSSALLASSAVSRPRTPNSPSCARADRQDILSGKFRRVPAKGAEGVIIAQGANIGGWSLYAKNGKLKYCYNVAGVNYFYVEAARALPAGEHQVRMEFAYAGGGLGKGGQVTLYVDGEKAGEGAIPLTQAMVFSADDGCDVGEDSGAPVSPDYGSRGNAFNGTVKGVQLAIGEAAESSDHLVSPEEAIRIAMARQ